MKGRARGVADARARSAGMAGSVLVHALALTFLLVAVPRREPGPPVYAVELVAAPLPSATKRLAPEAVSRPPEPAPVAPEPPKPAEKAPAAEAPVKPGAEKAPPKSQPKPTPVEQPTEKAAPTRSSAEPLPGETPGTGTDVANIKIPGIEFPYPDYLRNIMNEVLRRWNQPNSRLRAEVAFLILKDGSVRDIRFIRRSGNFSFDLEAQGAIESAGNANAFGPLPDGWDANVLPVTFVFEPRT